MAKLKILTDFTSYTDSALEQKAELIVDSMTDNAHFTAPVPAPADIRTALTAFDAAIVKAKEGGKVEKAERDAKRQELVVLLEKLALYVQMQGNENEAALASSGFSLSRTPASIGILEKPRNFTVKPDNVGMVKLSLKAIYGAKSYQYEYRKTNEEQWTVLVQTRSNTLITGLQSGQQYQFRVAGIGTAPERVYSDVLSSFVL